MRPMTTASSPSKLVNVDCVGRTIVVAGADHRGVRLEEQHRLGGHLVAELRRVLAVVAADADDLRARDDGREQRDVGERHALPRRLVPGEHRVALEDDELAVVDDPEADGVVVAEARDPHRISLAHGAAPARSRRQRVEAQQPAVLVLAAAVLDVGELLAQRQRELADAAARRGSPCP